MKHVCRYINKWITTNMLLKKSVILEQNLESFKLIKHCSYINKWITATWRLRNLLYWLASLSFLMSLALSESTSSNFNCQENLKQCQVSMRLIHHACMLTESKFCPRFTKNHFLGNPQVTNAHNNYSKP